jgi:hypothetical protein
MDRLLQISLERALLSGAVGKGKEVRGWRLEAEGKMTNGNELVGCISSIGFIG